jgi:hypothetical protein
MHHFKYSPYIVSGMFEDITYQGGFINMKKIFLIGLYLLMATTCFADKEIISEFDGNDYLGWPQVRKLSFLSGFLLANSNIISENKMAPFYCSFLFSNNYKPEEAQKIWETLFEGKKRKASFTKQEVALLLDYELIGRNQTLERYEIYGITVGQLNEGLNLFYNDFRNKQIKLFPAIFLVKKQISGTSSEEIEATIEWLRGEGKDFNKRFYLTKDGKKKYINFP